MVDGKISNYAWPDLEPGNKALYDALGKHMDGIKDDCRKTADAVLKVMDDFFVQNPASKPGNWDTIKTNFKTHAVDYDKFTKWRQGKDAAGNPRAAPDTSKRLVYAAPKDLQIKLGKTDEQIERERIEADEARMRKIGRPGRVGKLEAKKRTSAQAKAEIESPACQAKIRDVKRKRDELSDDEFGQ